MKIALDISPINTTNNSGHKVRGVGLYIRNLKNSLTRYCPENKYVFIEDLHEFRGETDILHIPYFDPFFVHLPKVKRLPTVVTVHDLMPLVFPQHFPSGVRGYIKWKMQEFLVKRCDAIITDSESSKKDISFLLGYDPKNIHVVYLAASEEFRHENVNQTQRNDLLKKYNLPEKFVLYVGDVTWNKNLPRLIRALSKTDIPAVMVGKTLKSQDYDPANLWNRDLQLINTELKGVKNIYKLGFVQTADLVKLYNLASCLIFPSLYEGFGLPVLEAMQCGCPVITTKNGSLPEVAGDAAMYINGEDENDIIENIRKVFVSDKLRKELSAKGLSQAQKFSWNKTARETVAVYNKVYETAYQPDIQ